MADSRAASDREFCFRMFPAAGLEMSGKQVERLDNTRLSRSRLAETRETLAKRWCKGKEDVMTSSISSNAMSMQRLSPLAMLQKNLVSEISSGKINSSDQDALSSALQTIDDSMRSSRAGGKPSPEEGKAKVEGMIDNMVSTGKLTDSQASELKQLFEDTFAGGPGGVQGRNGPPPPPPPSDEEDSTEGCTTCASGSADSTEALMQMLQELMQKLSENLSSKAYGTNGKTSTSSVSALFIDIAA